MCNIILSISRNNLLYETINDKIQKLISLGINGFRINLAKISDNEMVKAYESICNLIYHNNLYELEFIFDIPYPRRKIRITKLFNGYMELKTNDIIRLKGYDSCFEFSEKNVVGVDEIDFNISIGKIIYFADGEGAFECIFIKKNDVYLKALNNFAIYEGKSLTLGVIENQNYQELFNVCRNIKQMVKNFHFALSFTENKNDIDYFCNAINCSKEKVLSKIETQEGIDRINEILENSDGIILGRGDLYFYSEPNKFFCNCLNVMKNTLASKKKFYLCTDILTSLLDEFIVKRSDLIDISFFKAIGCENYILSAAFAKSENLNYAVKTIKESEIPKSLLLKF